MTQQVHTPATTGDRLWPLYAAVFNHALALAMLGAAIPFFVKQLGGSPTTVGFAGAATTGFYAAGRALLRTRINRIVQRG